MSSAYGRRWRTAKGSPPLAKQTHPYEDPQRRVECEAPGIPRSPVMEYAIVFTYLIMKVAQVALRRCVLLRVAVQRLWNIADLEKDTQGRITEVLGS